MLALEGEQQAAQEVVQQLLLAAVATFAEMDADRHIEDRARFPVREHFDIGAFGVNGFTADKADVRVIGEHDERGFASGGNEELYVVLNGEAAFTVGDEEFDAPAGTLVFVRPGTKRAAIAKEAATTILAIGGVPGEPYRPPVWEAFREFWPNYEAKDYEAAKKVLEHGLKERPDAAIGLYNLACVEALLGQPEPALDHLAKAIERDDRFVEQARGDQDFDAVRDDPRFAQLVPAE